MLKRSLDIVVSIWGLTCTAPLMVATALAIKLESPGPVFYRGVRVGRFGKPFKIFKFRTMVANAEKLGASSTSAHDPRITRIGKFMRSIKLDESPQLINVLKGEMSLVGPRPEVQKFVDQYTDDQRAILGARPGITDWSSIKFHDEGAIIAASGIADADQAYAQLIRPEKLRLQLKYVRQANVLTDVKIILATMATIVSTRLGKGAIGLPKN